MFGPRGKLRVGRAAGVGRGAALAARALELQHWNYAQDRLLKSKPKMWELEELKEAVDAKKAVIIDVRLKDDFEKSHASGAVNVPLFTNIQSMDPKMLFKKLVCAVNGVQGLEPNPSFVDSVRQVQRQWGGDGVSLVFMCDTGGSYQPLPAFMKGKQSRSLQSLDVAMQPPLSLAVDEAGVADGGLRSWGANEMSIEGSDPDFWMEKAKAAP